MPDARPAAPVSQSTGPLKYGAAVARLDAILLKVAAAGFITIADLAAAIEVSEMTVRRDLVRLGSEGKVRLVHGGVRATEQKPDNAFEQRRKLNWMAKDAIARAAAALIDVGDSIAIDAGSTTLHLLDQIAPDFDGSIVSHSIPVIVSAMVSARFRVVMLGGDLLRESAALIGPLSVEAASRVRVRTFFLGAAAIDKRGVYVSADIERPTKRALMDAADRVILLADHSKFSGSAPVLLCPLDLLDGLITDSPPPPAISKALKAAGVGVLIAEPMPQENTDQVQTSA
jgi:DeoR/GlpR family transcriptional regulator of sugar metabolism